jgi:HK97 family phage portal protein
MAFFGFGRKEKREAGWSGPGERWQWPFLFGSQGLPTRAGPVVNPDSAMRSSAVFACNRVISETIASLPRGVFKKTDDGGREPDPDHPVNIILKERANEVQTAFEFQELSVSLVNLRGNSVNFVQRSKGGEVLQLIPLLPLDSVTLEADGNRIVYKWTPPEDGRKEQTFRPDEIYHPKYLTKDGFWGIGPVEVAREAIGLDIAARQYGEKFFGNDATPRIALSMPGVMKEDAAARLNESWEENQGGDGQRGVAVLEGGLKIETLGLSNEDSQFLETRGFSIEDIARFFRMPLQLIQRQDKASTFASAEQFFQSYVTYTVVPWVTRLENAMNQSLLTETERKAGLFIKFIVEGLLRADTKTRFGAYAMALQNRWMNVNEVRALENMNPIEGGEVFENPNITPGEAGDDEPNEPTDTEGDEDV